MSERDYKRTETPAQDKKRMAERFTLVDAIRARETIQKLMTSPEEAEQIENYIIFKSKMANIRNNHRSFDPGIEDPKFSGNGGIHPNF